MNMASFYFGRVNHDDLCNSCIHSCHPEPSCQFPSIKICSLLNHCVGLLIYGDSEASKAFCWSPQTHPNASRGAWHRETWSMTGRLPWDFHIEDLFFRAVALANYSGPTEGTQNAMTPHLPSHQITLYFHDMHVHRPVHPYSVTRKEVSTCAPKISDITKQHPEDYSTVPHIQVIGTSCVVYVQAHCHTLTNECIIGHVFSWG